MVYPGAGVRRSGFEAISSNAPIFLNARKSSMLWKDFVL